MIELGSKVRDTVTGLSGIATARIEYLHGTPQVQISPPVGDSPGRGATWFEEASVELMDVEATPS